jgi:hypothetical protein
MTKQHQTGRTGLDTGTVGKSNWAKEKKKKTKKMAKYAFCIKLAELSFISEPRFGP